MKRIAIITPCILPVPATKGGAVEELITRIVEENENRCKLEIDLFSVASDKESGYYEYTHLIKLKRDFKCLFIDRIFDKYYRSIEKASTFRMMDRIIIDAFSDRIKNDGIKYDAVIIENMMSTACRIAEICIGCYSFPIFFHMHNDIDIYRSPEQLNKLVRHGVRFVAVSEYIKSQILKYSSDAIVSVLYNGVDLSKYKRVHSRNEKTVILYAGRIIPSKGVKELVSAFNNIIEHSKIANKNRLKLVVAGFSGLDKKYEKVIKQIANNCNSIVCLNQISSDEMPYLYEKADVVVMPTKNEEPFGLVALEAMAMGKTLIVTNSGALPEVVRDGALIINKNEQFTNNLEKGIIISLIDKKLTTKLSDYAYKRAHEEKRFDIKNYYDGFVRVIEPDMITESDKISIIVPVYNVKDYLKKCVLSLIRQTYTNIEIILVDDGSTDGSEKLCDELAVADSRIKVIHQVNCGLSGARNSGIDNATGKYLFFCDSDDYLEYNALEMLLNNLKAQDADVVACGIEKIYNDETCKEPEQFTNNIPGRWSGHESIIQMMRNNNICTVVWNKLYKFELFDGIRFPLGVKNEDEATIYKVLYNAKIVSYIPDTLYNYFQRDSSIMHENIKDRYRFFINAIVDRIVFFHVKGEYELEQHSRITLLDGIKYAYRNISNKDEKYKLLGLYNKNISWKNAPAVMGKKKQMALLLWKYLKY